MTFSPYSIYENVLIYFFSHEFLNHGVEMNFSAPWFKNSWLKRKFMIEKSGVGKSGVGKFMVEKSRIERSGVENSGVEMVFHNILVFKKMKAPSDQF
jgi:hypothetical protein